ncbi:MAG: flagellar hook-length control protein FliK [Nitrospiraceae bacterium]|nr:flagellar hook-length control protein FliK [Nitrospiraceae bacterium]
MNTVSMIPSEVPANGAGAQLAAISQGAAGSVSGEGAFADVLADVAGAKDNDGTPAAKDTGAEAAPSIEAESLSGSVLAAAVATAAGSAAQAAQGAHRAATTGDFSISLRDPAAVSAVSFSVTASHDGTGRAVNESPTALPTGYGIKNGEAVSPVGKEGLKQDAPQAGKLDPAGAAAPVAGTPGGLASTQGVPEIKVVHHLPDHTGDQVQDNAADSQKTPVQVQKTEGAEGNAVVAPVHGRQSSKATVFAETKESGHADGASAADGAVGRTNEAFAPAVAGGHASSAESGLEERRDRAGDAAKVLTATARHDEATPHQNTSNSAAVFAVGEKGGRVNAAVQGAGPVQAGDRIITVADQTFRISRKDERSVEVTLEPEGLGKIEIALGLDKGTVHATIHAVENSAKEILQRNLTNIVATLSREGIAIGGFSVSLKEHRDGPGAGESNSGDSEGNAATKIIRPSAAGAAAAGRMGLINIFA